MFVNPVLPVVTALLAAASSAASPRAYASRSCTELAAKRGEIDAAATRLAAWMERNCPGVLEQTEPFCRLQSGLLLERLDELGQLKAAIAAKQCEARESADVGAQDPVQHPRAVASFDDNWPWPTRRPFQAGLAATAGFKIRKCRTDPDCEW
jgi:hypothetical protein